MMIGTRRDVAAGPLRLRMRMRLHPLWWLAALAMGVRLLMFVGRGDYVAFDEGWYLLLGRNLLGGDGFTLSGLQHIALSPLFPILAGTVDLLLGNAIWSGRIVAAVTAGLLVVPCWFLFRRMAGTRTALISCILIIVMPSLAPFVAPYWIGWDLWVGAEPLLHLFLFAGIALALRARDYSRAIDWGAAGLTFGIAYLARPEAVIAFGFLALWLAALVTLKPRARRLIAPAAFVLGFAFAAAPYWIYLHEVTGRWTITGRDVAVTPQLPSRGADAGAVSRPVDQMLWADDDEYERGLFALDASGERLADGYWGVAAEGAAAVRAATAPIASDTDAAEPPTVHPVPHPVEAPGVIALYIRTLGTVVPLYLWPFVLIGVLVPRRTVRREELIGALPITATSLVIAVVVAVDPRTQLLLVPLAAFYAARGIRSVGILLARRLRAHGDLRRGFTTAGVAVLLVTALFATDVRRLYLSLEYGSPHHLVGAENRRVGEALRHVAPLEASVMSWHPAIALYARRDWRVLPLAPFDRVVRYANAIACEYLVLSAYYPSPLSLDNLPAEYMVLYVPRRSQSVTGWRLELAPQAGAFVYGELKPVSAPAARDPADGRADHEN